MSYALSTIKQIRFPVEDGALGRFQVIINRPGTTGLSITAADTLLLANNDTLYPSPFLLAEAELPLSKKTTSLRGRRALDNVTIQIRDSLTYNGTIDSIVTTEDFSATYQTFFDVWLNEGAPYPCFILWKSYASPSLPTPAVEVALAGTVDPLYKPISNPNVINAGTLQQIYLGDRALKIIEAGDSLKLPFSAVLANIGPSDCQNGVPYHGFMYAPPGCANKTNTRDGAFSSNKGGWYQAVPHVHLNNGGADPVLRRLPSVVWPTAPFVDNTASAIATFSFSLSAFFSHGYNNAGSGSISGGSVGATWKTVDDGTGNFTKIVLTSPGSGYAVGDVVQFLVTTGGGDGTLNCTVDSVNAKSVWGPSGLVFISIGTLFAKIAEALGLGTFTPSTDLKSALSWWSQRAGANNDFPIDTANEIPVDEIYVSLNVIAKSHPYDGSFWDNPIGWSPIAPISDVLNGLCNFLIAQFEEDYDSSGNGSLLTKALGTVGDDIPTEWINEGVPQQEDPATGPRSVSVKNRADDLAIQCPFGTPGDVSEIDVPFPIHRIARTSHEVGGNNWDKAAVTFDNALTFDQQAQKCFEVVWYDGNGVGVPNPDCWKSLRHAYWFNASNTNLVYPSTWDAFPNNDGTTGDWSNSFYVINAIYKAGATPPADLQAEFHGDDYFNTRDYHSVAFATLSIALDTVQTFQYIGVADDTGSVQNVSPGMHGLWALAGASQDWQAIQITQGLRFGRSQAKFQAYPNAGAFPNLTDLPYGPIGSGGGTQSSTGGSTIGGGVSLSTQNSAWNILTPTQLTTNTNNWALLQLHGQTVMYVSSSTQITLTGLTGGAANDFIVMINNGTHPITLLNDNAASTAANRFLFAGQSGLFSLGTNGKVGLLYDSTVQRWRLIF